jgi:hypothetical protein
MDADFRCPEGPPLNDLYLIVHAVDELPPGAYVWRNDQHALELLQEGNFRRAAGYLGLGQELPADASVNIFFLATLRPILEVLATGVSSSPTGSWPDGREALPGRLCAGVGSHRPNLL